jgi:hemerythrin
VALLQWSDSLSVGYPAIDEQHKELIRRISGLLGAMRVGQGKAELESVLDFLGAYVVEHFGDEQKLMQRFRYPGYAAHKALHDAFINDVTALRRDLVANGPTAAGAIQVQRRVVDWTVSHIGQVDQQLAAYLRAQA